MKHQALQYYMHDGPTAFRFELAGNLNHEGARRLDQDWLTALSVIGDRRLIVDMTFIAGADEQGRALIIRWHREGARLIANSKASRALAESILGESLSGHPASAGDTTASDRAWLPFLASFLVHPVTLLLLAAIMFSIETNAATLKSETVAAWDDYVQTANANLQDRVGPGGTFLWTFEDAARAPKVRSREIVVAPSGKNPKKVPGGLIHHWLGALFVPNLKLDDILEVTRDYDHYKEFYHPSVVESKAIARSGSDDSFSMLIMNKAFFLKTALDMDCESTIVRLDELRAYSISKTARVQEVEEYGQPGEHRKPEGEGRGYIWKLYSIARLEQRDDGVYVELEALALSRDIPAAVRFWVNPIVRRVSRNSLFTSLDQTEKAVCGRFADAARSPASLQVPSNCVGDSGALSSETSAFTKVH